jgi:hypothetical protein
LVRIAWHSGALRHGRIMRQHSPARQTKGDSN